MKFGNDTDIKINHYINSKTKNGYTFIIISVTYDIYDSDLKPEIHDRIKYYESNEYYENYEYDVFQPLWDNTFVLITNIDYGYYTFKYRNKELNDKVYVVNNITFFIPENFDK